ncbi:hypothetical protein DSO57_1030400 [Entomophthora muscae]|uniref:Uncharacterized protein n=1 Tax=Entomophthora muscae TaxID=34485 RepID=A0ACC2S312_9FUNG|nr:hypothetical protein DSO57_1030400 [Entomophthora muscae]
MMRQEHNDSTTFKLELDQFPTHAKQCALTGRVEKRPLDPPPVLHVVCSDPQNRKFMTHPNFHIRATLVTVDTQEAVHLIAGERPPLSGTIEQSIIKLEDTNRTPRGFFIFSDLSVRLTGRFCIRFSLCEERKGMFHLIHRIYSSPFEVVHHKVNIPIQPPTALTLALKRQGVKLRITQPPRGKKRLPPPIQAPRAKHHYVDSPILLTPTSSFIRSPLTAESKQHVPTIYHSSFPKPHRDEFRFTNFLRSLNILPINSYL